MDTKHTETILQRDKAPSQSSQENQEEVMRGLEMENLSMKNLQWLDEQLTAFRKAQKG